MCSPTVLMVTTGLAGAAFSAYGSYQQATQQQDALNQQAFQSDMQAMAAQTQAMLTDSQAATSDTNARLAQMDADQALINSQKEAKAKRIQTLRLIGDDIAQNAANGINVNSGTAVGMYSQAAYAGELDAQGSLADGRQENFASNTEKVNYQNQAEAQRVDASGLRAQSAINFLNGQNLRNQADSINPFGAALGSIIGSAASLGQNFWSIKKPDYVESMKIKYGV